MAQPVAKRQKLGADEAALPQPQGVRYHDTTAQGNSRNVYGQRVYVSKIVLESSPF
jgi:hypothetical protein